MGAATIEPAISAPITRPSSNGGVWVCTMVCSRGLTIPEPIPVTRSNPHETQSDGRNAKPAKGAPRSRTAARMMVRGLNR